MQMRDWITFVNPISRFQMFNRFGETFLLVENNSEVDVRERVFWIDRERAFKEGLRFSRFVRGEILFAEPVEREQVSRKDLDRFLKEHNRFGGLTFLRQLEALLVGFFRGFMHIL